MQHFLNSRRTLPCQRSFFPPTASRCSAVGSSPGRLSTDPGRWQSPCPGTQPPGAQGRCSEGQPWAPLAAHPAAHPCSHPWEKAAIVPCPSDGAGANPCSGACPPPLHYGNCDSPDRSYRLWEEPALGDPSRNHRFIVLQPETYRVEGCEEFTASELSASSHSRLPLTSLCLTPLPSAPAGSALSPAGLCRGAAPGQSSLSAALPACHELPPSQEPSPAQQQRTSSRHLFLCSFWAPSRCPWGSRGTCWETG